MKWRYIITGDIVCKERNTHNNEVQKKISRFGENSQQATASGFILCVCIIGAEMNCGALTIP